MTAKQYTDLMVRLGRMDAKMDAQADLNNSKMDTLLEGQKVQNGRLGKHDDMIAGILTDLAETRGETNGSSSSWKKLVTVLTIVIAGLMLYVAWKNGILYHAQ